MDSAMKHRAQLKGAAVSGMELTLTDSGYTKAYIAGSPYDSRREYWIATNDYMAQGGDGFNSFSGITLGDAFKKAHLRITRLNQNVGVGFGNRFRVLSVFCELRHIAVIVRMGD